MIFLNALKKINNNYHLLFFLLITAFLARLISFNLYGDYYLSNEWKILLNNLLTHKSYVYYNFEGNLIPSVYMPPAYPFFLYAVKLISFNKIGFVHLVIFIQILLSTYSIYLFYKLNIFFFSEKISLINSYIFSFFPLNIYASIKLSSVNLQIFLSLMFLYLLFLVLKKSSKKNIVLFSITSALLILTRGEFVLIFFSFIAFLLIYKKISFINLVKIILIVSLIISPYVLRNYYHFNQIVLVKSLGFNLWKGNNQLSLIQGYENYENDTFSKLNANIQNVKKDKFYEINRDNIFLTEAKKNIFSDTQRYFYLFFKKLFAFYFVDWESTHPKYFNFFNFFPNLALSILSIPGLIVFFKKSKFELRCLALYLLTNLLIFSIFFILPRYKLIILPVQIIMAGYFIQYLVDKYKSNKLL
tara:strand:+ start:8927 stop:10171 length:1245 start_codon:yes stop_codon:yes gene_type:complete